VRSAVSLCGSLFANVFRFDGELLHFVAGHNVGLSYVELLRAKYPMRPDFSQVSGRVLRTKSVVRLEDVLADPEYDQRFSQAMGWRKILGMPLLREGDPFVRPSSGSFLDLPTAHFVRCPRWAYRLPCRSNSRRS